jgi:hypothetical protein
MKTHFVPVKQSILPLFFILLAWGALSARAQVAASAYRRGISISAGGEGSAFQPDYAAGGLAPETSPNRVYGLGAYVDVRFSRWVQVEAEGHWLHFGQFYALDSPIGNGEDTYLIGPRLPIHTFRRATPYVKALIGFGNANFLTGRTTTVAYGGGLDYRLSKRFTLRAFDFEYQQWRITPPMLYPYGGSVGISYKIF